MLGLPPSTQVRRSLPKAQLFRQLDWTPSQRDRFDAYVSRLDFTHWIAPRTLPAVGEGSDIKEIFVVEVSLKSRDFDEKSITLLARSIPQHIVYLLRYEDEVLLATYHTKLFATDWQPIDGAAIQLDGLTLDAVWQSIVASLGCFSVDTDSTLTEQIRLDEERDKLCRQITTLERQVNTTKQPRRKRELFLQLQLLKQKQLT